MPLVRWTHVAAIVCVLASGASARKPEHALCDTVGAPPAEPPYVVVLGAMPSELAPLVEAAEIEQSVEVDGRPYYVGRLDGVRVVLGITLIGMVNAETHAESLLGAFDAAAVLMSGVAGSHHRIADVVIPTGWVERDKKRVWRTNRALVALARRAAAGLAPLEQCTPVPPSDPGAPLVCMPHEPAVVFEDRGESGDDFGGAAFACVPGGGDIFGCELPVSSPAGALVDRGYAAGAAAEAAADYPDAIDMESAAVGRVAVKRRVPFLVMRAVSDGAGDPLGDRGFPAQFFDYYRLAARNAAAVTRAIVAEIGRTPSGADGERVCRLLAKGRWAKAAKRLDAVSVE
jgi:adenosylhomocysteine nucleosidase